MNTDSVSVSVVLPTYNRADVLGRSIESVINQTYEDFELIIVDDGSTDETDAIVEGFDDDRIRYVQHNQNKGAAAARNTGIQETEADIVAFQDSDDVWDERKLKKQVTVFENSPESVGVVYTGIRKVFKGFQTRVPGHRMDRKNKKGNIQKSLLKFNFVSTQAAAVRTSCFDRVGMFDEELPPLEDWELWIRISDHYTFNHIDESLVTAYRREDSISNDIEAIVRARERIVKKHRDRFNSETLARQLFWIGHGALKTGNTNKGQTYLGQAVEANPRLLYFGTLGLSLFGSKIYRLVYSRYKQFNAPYKKY